MEIAPESRYYEELGPPGRLARDVPPLVHEVQSHDDGLEALAVQDTHDALLARVFNPVEAQDFLHGDMSKTAKTRMIGSKLRQSPAFTSYAREYGIDHQTPSTDTRNPMMQSADWLIEVSATYAATEQRVMDYLGNPQFFEYLEEPEVNKLRKIRDQGKIEDQLVAAEKLFVEDFSVKQQRYLELRSNKEVMGWISKSNPAAAQALDISASPNLRRDLPLLQTLTENYVHEQKEIKREQERKAAEEQRAAQQEAARLQKEAEQADKLAVILSEGGLTFNKYLQNRKKNPLNPDQLVDEMSVTKALSILENEYNGPKYKKYLEKLPPQNTEDSPQALAKSEPSLGNLPANPKAIPRLLVINEEGPTSRARGLVVQYQKPNVTAQQALESLLSTTGKLSIIKEERLAAASSALKHLEDLKKGTSHTSGQKAAALVLTTLAMTTLSSGALNNQESNSGSKANMKALIQAQAAPEVIAPVVPAATAVANVDPAVTGGAVAAPSPELQTAIKAYESLPDDTRLTKETKNAAVAWAIETTRAITAGKSAALNASEPSLEGKPEAKRSVELVDQIVLLSLDHITRGDLDKSDIRELTEELSRITALARHPSTLHKLLIAENLNKINPKNEFEKDLGSLISEKLLRDSPEYTDVQKRLIGKMLAQSVSASISPDKRQKVLQDFRVKVTMLNPPTQVEKTPEKTQEKASDNTDFHKISPKVGYGMSEKAREIYKQILIDAGKKYNVNPNLTAAFYYAEQGHGDTASKIVDVKQIWREPKAPYGTGPAYAESPVGAGGPQQFMPRTWIEYGVDANGDGTKDKQDLKDAVYGATRMIAANKGTKNAGEGARRYAAFRYNPDQTYVENIINVFNYLESEQDQANAHVRKLKAQKASAVKQEETKPPEAVKPPEPLAAVIVTPPVEGAVPAVTMDANAVAKSIVDAAKESRHRAAVSEKKWEVTEKGGEHIEGAIDLGMHKGAYVGGVEIETRLYAIEGFKCSNEECSPGDPMYIEGANGNVIVGAKAAKATAAMYKAAKKDGLVLTSNSSYRTHEHQKALFAAKPDPNWVATPGNSDHQDPQESAIDFNMGPGVFKWLSNNAHKYGFVNYDRENWHWAFKNPDNKW